MALPTLRSELDCLQNLHQALHKRLSLERVYTTSLAAWLADALETGPQPTHALCVVFFSLFENTEKDIESRRAMEDTLQSQIDRVLAEMGGLEGPFERFDAHSKRLEEFDKLTIRALEKRKIKYEEWKDWKSRPASPAGGRLLAKPRKPPALTESKMAAAYDRADMQVRRHISQAEVARCSLKDKAIEGVEAISRAYWFAIDAITRCLWLFAKNQQECASNASAGANMIVKVADEISGFRVANAFQEVLASEVQNISTASIQYEDLESSPNIQSQPIVLGFSLPPYNFSCTASTSLVVNVFCQLVSFVHDHTAWDDYANRSSLTDYALARSFRDLERSWTKDEDLNRNLLRGLGPSTCANLVKTLLASFSEPLLDCSEAADGNQRLITWAEQRNQNDAMALVPLVPPLHNRPQGEMFRALCASLLPVFRGRSQKTEDLFSEVFSDLLTRKGECIKHVFPVLVRELSALVTITNTISALQRPVQDDPARSGGTTPESEESVRDEDNTPTINDVDSLKRGTIQSAKGKAKAPYTILLVGETGVGKSSLLDFITNVLIGNNIDCYDFTIHDHSNEKIIFGTQSQNDLAYFYEVTSNNSVVVRILDISGLTDTRGLKQDEIHKKSIVTEIQKHLDFVSAVLIVANGTVQRITVGMDYAFSTLSAILPNTLANNIAFVFTNVASHLSCNFPWDDVPEVFKDAPQFLLDNPVALQKKYLQFEDGFYSADERVAMRSEVEAGERRALEMLVGLFDWLDGLKPRPTTDIVYFYDIPQAIEALIPNILAQIDRAIAKKAEIDKLMTTLKKSSADMGAFSNFERIANMPTWRLQPTSTNKNDRQMSVDEDMKKKWEAAKNEKEKTAVLITLNRMVLHDLNQVINHAPSELVQLVERYAPLPLSKRILEKLGSTARRLEQMHKVMEKKGVSQDLLQQVNESLNRTKEELGLE